MLDIPQRQGPRRTQPVASARSKEHPRGIVLAPQRICLVLPALPDASVSGGELPGLLGLAQQLSAAGHLVTLLLAPVSDQLPAEDAIEARRQEYFEKYLLNIDTLPLSTAFPSGYGDIRRRSAHLCFDLKTKNFDVVYLPLEGGIGYYTVLAKETGVFARAPQLVVVAQNPLVWQLGARKQFMSRLEEATVAHMERYCAEGADGLVATSQVVMEWMRQEGWKLPSRAGVIPPLRPYDWRLPPAERALAPHGGPPEELVLMEHAGIDRGLPLFCDALDRLAQQGDSAPLTITMFGAFDQILGEHTGGYLLRRARRWPHAIRLLPRTSPAERLSYAKARNCLVVFPNLCSAADMFLAACIGDEIPFIATRVGAAAEQIDEASQADVLCEPTAAALSEKLSDVLAHGMRCAKASSVLAEAPRAWLDAFSSPRPEKPSRKRRREDPLVSVILVHHDRPEWLSQALRSVEEQDYANIEVVLVDDGSVRPSSHAKLDSLAVPFRKRGWRILREKNRYLGAARNAGIRAAAGSHILFLDDDNVLFKNAVSTLVGAMEKSDADICPCLARMFSGEVPPAREEHGLIEYLPLGGCASAGFLENVFGDANAMFRRDVFDRIGMLTEEHGVSGEDWEIFARASLSGLKVRLVPQPLYWYRKSPTGMWRSTHWYDTHKRILATYSKMGMADVGPVLEIARSAFADQNERMMHRNNLAASPSNATFVELCSVEPNSEAAVELLATAAAAEGRTETALALMAQCRRLHVRGGPLEQIGSLSHSDRALAELEAGWTAEQELRVDELRQFTALSGHSSAGAFYVEAPNRLYMEVEAGEVAIARLKGGCPAGTGAVKLYISLDDAVSRDTEFAAACVSAGTDASRLGLERVGQGVRATTGWVVLESPGEYREVELTLPKPCEEASDLVLAVRIARGSPRQRNLGCFSWIRVQRSLVERRPKMGAPRSAQRARALTIEECKGAALVTRHPSRLPLLLHPPEGGLFLRPLAAGPVVAQIDYAFPPFARSVRGYVEVAHEDASPFEFAIALSMPGAHVTWTANGPEGASEFSGWVPVEKPFVLHEIALRRDRATNDVFNMSFAVRVPSGSKESPSNTFWRRIILSWTE